MPSSSSEFVFLPPPIPSVEVTGTQQRFPVHRIYCIGRNYADHVREMGLDAKEPPGLFTKPADALVPNGGAVPYPPKTENFHHEVELVVALGTGGRNIDKQDAQKHIFGYAVGNDLTRRDLQAIAKKKGFPWDTAKGADGSAPVGPIRPVSAGHIDRGRIWLSVNGELRQQADLADMIWTVPKIIAEISTFYELRAGDLIFTGTPAGVGALKPGDRIECGVDGLETLRNTITATAHTTSGSRP